MKTAWLDEDELKEKICKVEGNGEKDDTNSSVLERLNKYLFFIYLYVLYELEYQRSCYFKCVSQEFTIQQI